MALCRALAAPCVQGGENLPPRPLKACRAVKTPPSDRKNRYGTVVVLDKED